MAIKAILFDDPECGVICDDAMESIKQVTGVNEIERMSITEGLKKYDLGDPEGVPFIGFISEATGKLLSRSFFHDEDGKIIIQKYPSIVEQTVQTK